MQPSVTKRKAATDGVIANGKRLKSKKQWATPRKDPQGRSSGGGRELEPGDSGIWITCEMGKEARCVTELRALFEEHAEHLHEESTHQGEITSSSKDNVEDAIDQELNELRNNESQLFRSIKLHDQCLLFFKTMPPIDPVSFVLSFCKDVASNPGRKRAHAVKRLTPMTLIGKATENGIDELAKKVLDPHFNLEGVDGRKFAVRPNLRNNTILSRNSIIRQVAAKVGPKHKVDLKNYDLLILVEVYKNLCGMSVVGKEYDLLKRYNLAEIKQSTDAQ